MGEITYEIREAPIKPTLEQQESRIAFLESKVRILKEAIRNPSTSNKAMALEVWDREEW